jgi:hypothetical protein
LSSALPKGFDQLLANIARDSNNENQHVGAGRGVCQFYAMLCESSRGFIFGLL